MEISAKVIVIACAAIVIVAISSLVMVLPLKQNVEAKYSVHPEKREFWLFNSNVPEFNETKVGMSHDMFSLSTITVNKGDTVIIHFLNTEPPGGDSHSFTIYDKPYDVNVVLNPGENKTVSFDAIMAGVFTYECTFHQPTMRGQLTVLAPGQP